MGFYVAQLLTGLADAAALFLVAAGLSLIFGVTRIVNFAHGSLYMLGAFTAFSVAEATSPTLGFWASLLIAPLVVGVIGVLLELVVLRRLYGGPELYPLVATFGAVLLAQDAALAVWGAEDRIGPRPAGLDGAVRLLGEPIPEYDLFLIAAAPTVLAAMWLLLHRTRFGLLTRAATQDREMAAALGVDQRLLFTGVFFLGAALAGLGGALQVPREGASLLMDLSVIAQAFVVVVVGGMGSLIGAFAAAALIGVVNAFGLLILPEITLALPFLLMAAVLILRPHGLFGAAASAHAPMASTTPTPPLAPPSRRAQSLAALGVAALAAAPLVIDGFALVLMTETFIAVLLAASLQFLMGVGGIVSFGHAALFGLGAYGAALSATSLGLPIGFGLVAGAAFGALGGGIVGAFCARLSGVYLAMLTLAFAQILWSGAIQFRDVTGGDDGILGVWPPDALSSPQALYWLALALATAGVWLLRRLAHAPFGLALRAARDHEDRADAIGIDAARHRWAAFVAAGLVAGLGGALFAYAKGSVFPDELAIPRSVDALIMVLLGGAHALSGPIIGAAAFIGLEDVITRFDHWRAMFGALIVALTLLAPNGAAGALAAARARIARSEGAR